MRGIKHLVTPVPNDDVFSQQVAVRELVESGPGSGDDGVDPHRIGHRGFDWAIDAVPILDQIDATFFPNPISDIDNVVFWRGKVI